MLDRVLEPEVMDSLDLAQQYDEMDHAEVNRLFVDDFLAHAPDTSEVLDLGTGTAQIPVALCRRDDAACVVAVDLATSMLDLARLKIEVAGLIGRILLECVDGKQLPYADDRFSAVISNSIVHHVPDPAQPIAEAVRVTQPGGWIFFRDLLRPDSDAEVARLVDLYAAGANDQQRQLFDDSLRAALTLDEVQDVVARLGFARDTVIATSDRHWTFASMKPSPQPDPTSNLS